MITRAAIASDRRGADRPVVSLLGGLGRAVASAAATAAVMPAVIRLVAGRLPDEPNERSSHTEVTPRGGGIGPALAATAVLGVWWPGPRGRRWAAATGGAAAMGALGLADDLCRLPAQARLGAQAVTAGAAGWLLCSGTARSAKWDAVVAAVAAGWMVSFVNAFNFMDGIDGISGLTAVAAGCCWLALGVRSDVGALVSIGAVAAGAGAGFLPYNFPRARVFLGDVGSYFLGGLLAAGAVVGWRAGLAPEAVLAPLALYLADTATTLLRRAAAGQDLLSAHRDHTYQRMCRAGWSHPRTALLVGSLCALSGAAGIWAQTGGTARLAGDVVVAGITGAYLCLPTALARRSSRPEVQR